MRLPQTCAPLIMLTGLPGNGASDLAANHPLAFGVSFQPVLVSRMLLSERPQGLLGVFCQSRHELLTAMLDDTADS